MGYLNDLKAERDILIKALAACSVKSLDTEWMMRWEPNEDTPLARAIIEDANGLKERLETIPARALTRDELIEENRVLHNFMRFITLIRPHFAYASAGSHPHTNLVHSRIGEARRALRAVERLRQEQGGGSE